MSIATFNDREVVDRPQLPTCETLADGVILKAEKLIWLSKEDKYRLHLAVEELTVAGYTADEVFAAVGIDRKEFYTYIWFNPEQAEKYANVLAQQTQVPPLPEAKANAGSVLPRKKKRTAQGKLDTIKEVDRLVFMESLDLDEACRIMRITRQRFYNWSSITSKLMMQAKRERDRAQRREDRRTGRTPSHASRRILKEEVDCETKEQRQKLVEQVQDLVQDGEEFLAAVRKTGIRALQYHAWVLDTEHEERARVKPTELWKTCQNEPDNRDARERFIKHFFPIAERLAKKHANYVRSRHLFEVDETNLLSVALYEGIEMHIDKFDPDRGVPLSTYFHQKMSQRILDELRGQDWVPRTQRAREKERRYWEQKFFDEKNQFPSDDELIDFSHEQDLLFRPIPTSLSADAIHESVQAGGKAWTAYDVLHDGNSQDEEMRRIAGMVSEVLIHVTGREREVLQLYYLDGKTMQEVGEIMNLSESRISHLHASAILQLQQVLAGSPDMPHMHTD